MGNKSTSTERQLFILSLLSQRKSGYTVNEIIDSLKRMADIDATRRMVARDMDYISQNFFVYEEELDGKIEGGRWCQGRRTEKYNRGGNAAYSCCSVIL